MEYEPQYCDGEINEINQWRESSQLSLKKIAEDKENRTKLKSQEMDWQERYK